MLLNEIVQLLYNWNYKIMFHQMVLDNFIPPMLEAVLADYQRCTVPSAREPEVSIYLSIYLLMYLSISRLYWQTTRGAPSHL